VTANLRRLLLGGAAILGLVALDALPAAGQSAETTTTTAPPAAAAEQRIAGRFASGATPIEGVRVVVEGVEPPGFRGEATSDADGRWDVAVPGPGTYRVAIDTDSIPEGFELADPDRFELPRFPVFAGAQVRNAVFRFASDEQGGVVVPNRVERLARLLFSGVRLGLIIGLVSVGLSLIFGTTGLVNFAHGELVTAGALLAWFWSASNAGPEVSLVLAAVLAVVLCAALGASLEYVVWRPMVRRRSGAVARMLVSIGLALFLRHLYVIFFEASPRRFRDFSAQEPVDLGPLRNPPRDFAVMAICLVVLVGVGLLLERTRLGTAVRAVADERELAAASGIDVGRVIVTVWVGGAALAGLGGILYGVGQGVQWNMGFRLLLTMFAAVVLGGLGSAYGAMAGGLVVGVASEVSTYWIDADFKFAVALAILILVLIVRPQGILGVRERVG